MTPPATRYRLETVSRTCQVLKAFRDERDALSLADVVLATAIEKTIVFRILHTLEAEGLLRKVDGHRYRSNVSIARQDRFRIGYAEQSSTKPFSDSVTQSLEWAAARNGLDLIVLDNRYSVQTALRNADRLIALKVDLAIE